MKNLSPNRTQQLINTLKQAKLLLQTGQEEFLRRLKKDLYISNEIDVIQWEVNTLYGAGSDEANHAQRERVMLYLRSLMWLWLESDNKYAMNEDISHVFNTIYEMYFQFENAGKLK